MNKKSLNILLIEDSSTDAFTIKDALNRYADAPNCSHAETFAQGEKILQEGNIDLVFLDLGLPDTSSPEDTYKEAKKWTHKLPIVVLTHVEDHELARVMVHEGIADFLHKDMIIKYPQRIKEAIDFALERHTMRRKIADEKEALRKESEKKDAVLNCFMGGYSIDSDNS